jgi:hypothetical protein
MNLPTEMPDEMNPRFMFQGTHDELLSQIVLGKIDPIELAKRELANRGHDQHGEWVGFKKAEELFFS